MLMLCPPGPNQNGFRPWQSVICIDLYVDVVGIIGRGCRTLVCRQPLEIEQGDVGARDEREGCTGGARDLVLTHLLDEP